MQLQEIFENHHALTKAQKCVVVKKWQARGNKLTAHRIKAMFGQDIDSVHGQDIDFTLDQWPEMQALLMKFSPIWHVGYADGLDKEYVYVYSDGSVIRVLQDSERCWCSEYSITYGFDKSEMNAIYDKLVELGLVKVPLQNKIKESQDADHEKSLVMQFSAAGTKISALRIRRLLDGMGHVKSWRHGIMGNVEYKVYAPQDIANIKKVCQKLQPIFTRELKNHDANYLFADGSFVRIYTDISGRQEVIITDLAGHDNTSEIVIKNIKPKIWQAMHAEVIKHDQKNILENQQHAADQYQDHDMALALNHLADQPHDRRWLAPADHVAAAKHCGQYVLSRDNAKTMMQFWKKLGLASVPDAGSKDNTVYHATPDGMVFRTLVESHHATSQRVTIMPVTRFDFFKPHIMHALFKIFWDWGLIDHELMQHLREDDDEQASYQASRQRMSHLDESQELQVDAWQSCIDQWYARGTHVTEQRIKTLLAPYFNPDMDNSIHGQLDYNQEKLDTIMEIFKKFSPIYIKSSPDSSKLRGKYFYFYADGSVINMAYNAMFIGINFFARFADFKNLLSEHDCYQLYKALVAAGVVQAGACS